MNFKRIGMAIVSLVLVACLIVNVSPVKAEATGLGFAAAIASVPAAPVIGAVLIGLGIGVGAVASNWDKVVDDLVEHYKSNGVIGADGDIDIYSLSGAGYQYGIAEDVISGVRDWVFENGIVTEKTITVGDGYWMYNDVRARPIHQDVDTSKYPYIALGKYVGDGTIIMFFCDQPIVQTSYSSLYGQKNCYGFEGAATVLKYAINSSTVVGWDYVETLSNITSLGYCNISSYWSNHNIYGTYFYNYGALVFAGSNPVTGDKTEIVLNSELIAGHIASVADSIADGYQKWAEKYVDLSVLDPDLPAAVYPLSYSPSQTLTDIHGLTQEEVWAGILSGVTLPDEDVTTKPDIGDISIALGDISASVFLNALADRIETLPLIPPRIEDAIEQLPIIIRDIRDSITTFPIWQDNLLNHIETFPDKLSLALDDVKVGVRSITDTLTRTLAETRAIAAERVDVLTDAFVGVFVPSEGYIDAKVEALTLEFPVVEDIKKTGEDLKEFALNLGQKPPIIYIDLGAQRGFHNIGGRVPFIDLTWYAEYKPTMDAILSAFLWMWFAWRMFLSLPGILHGSSGLWHFNESHVGQYSTPIGTFNDKPYALNSRTDPAYEELLEIFFDGPEVDDWLPGEYEYFRAHPPTYEDLLEMYHDPLSVPD